MEFFVLSGIAVLGLIYCCDIPAIDGFAFLIHDKSSMIYAVGLSFIAAYIFYVIQVYVPEKRSEKKAYNVLKVRINIYLEEISEVVAFCESLCEFSDDKETIVISSPYVRVIKNGEETPWITKVDIDIYSKREEKNRKAIIESGCYMQLEEGKRNALQQLFDNSFLHLWAFSVNATIHTSSPEIFQSYAQLGKQLIYARRRFKMQDTISFLEYTDQKRIDEFEQKILLCDEKLNNENTIRYMRIKD